MLFVRVIARLSGVVLPVNGALGLETVEWATAIVAGEDNFIGARRPLEGVASDHSRPVAGLEALRAIGVVRAEPPDFQVRITWNHVYRDDGALVGLGEDYSKWVQVGPGIERVAVGLEDVAGKVSRTGSTAQLPSRRHDPVTHI